MADVNAAFYETRLGQIAEAYASRDRMEAANERSFERYTRDVAAFDQRMRDGKLRDLGNGRFRVTDPGSWDDNEVLYLSQPTPQSVALILPETGLDEIDGRAQLYTAVPSWHSLEGAGLIPGGTTDIDDVLKAGGIAWRVEQSPARYYAGRKLRTDPDHFENWRDDTFAGLGVVGKIYEPIQNMDAMAFLLELTGKDQLLWESAGSMRGGRKVFVCVRLPEDIVIDAEGINDIIRPYLAVINTHDGSGLFKAYVTPWRIQCGNTERFSVRDAHTSWGVRHTKNAPDRIAEAQKSLGLTVEYFGRYAEEENQLARIDFELDQFQSLLGSLWEPAKDGASSKRNETTFARRTDTLNAMYEVQAERTGKTAYSAERTVTDYLDNVAPRRMLGGSMAAARATAVLEGTDDAVKSKAHQKLMRLVNA